MKKLYKFLFPFLFSVFMISGCQESTIVQETKESAEKFGSLINTFTENVDEMQIEGNGTEVQNEEVKVIDTFKLLKKSSDNSSPVAKSGAHLIRANVLNIVDGDTIDVEILDSNSKNGLNLNNEERVRFILINTPESKGDFVNNPQPFSKEAESFTKNVLNGKSVWLELGVQERDTYGRLLAYVWLNSISYEYFGEKHTFKNITMNELLLIEGLAKVAVYPPNTQYLEDFKELESSAKKGSAGLWTIE